MDKQKGLSLIELMIAITLGLILLTGVMQVFLSSKTVFSTQQALSRVQETGRLAVEFLSKDIRMAGYMGCATRVEGMKVINTLKNSSSALYDFATAIMGYTDSNIPSGILSKTLTPNTDVIIIRSAGGSGVEISKTNNSAQLFATNVGAVESGACSNGTDKISGLCIKDIVVATDCEKTRVFQITNLSVSGSDVNVVHGTSSFVPGNDLTSWGGASAPASETFGPGAELLMATNTIYFVATGEFSSRPSLWQKINNNDSMEILEGVEDMNVLYGVDTDGDYVPDKYVRAEVMVATEWPQVVAVKIDVLVSSIEDNVISETQKITFANEEIEPTDRRLRQVFNVTVGIRSRLL
jgi:type IV pilus assembly protein PilW